MADGIEKATVLIVASGEMPVTPKPFGSPPISPSTAVPWFALPVIDPPTRPPLFCSRSSWFRRQLHSRSIIRTPEPVPPDTVQA